MRPGAQVVVVEREPGGVLSVDLGSRTVAVGSDLAGKVWVKQVATPSGVA
jgi:Fe2+ transport system protein FeoA